MLLLLLLLCLLVLRCHTPRRRCEHKMGRVSTVRVMSPVAAVAAAAARMESTAIRAAILPAERRRMARRRWRTQERVRTPARGCRHDGATLPTANSAMHHEADAASVARHATSVCRRWRIAADAADATAMRLRGGPSERRTNGGRRR